MAFYFPTIGILVFVVLFIYSSTLYPGGSQADLKSVGFDWYHNYWCNLLREEGMNGEQNPARPIAIFAMLILCISLAVFFYQFSVSMPMSPFWKYMIQVGGLLSMGFVMLLFTSFHDQSIIISSIFGLAAIIGMLVVLWQNQSSPFLWSFVFCLFLFAINNYIYYSNHYVEVLPFIQKISLAATLLWISWMNLFLVMR